MDRNPYAAALLDLWCAQQETRRIADDELLTEVRGVYEHADPVPADLVQRCLEVATREDSQR